MKKVILSSLFLLGAYSYAQVGVNTANPQSTLDVTAKNTTGTTTNVDGLLVPRVDRQRAESMTGIPTSTLIYVNSIATGNQTGKTQNIDAVGYYYYDGTVWAKFNSSSSPSSNINIYNADGTLTGNRTVTQADKTLTFTGTAKNAFSIDGTTFSADATNHRVGIGTISPSVKLDVQGSQLLNVAITGAATKNALDINVGQDGFGYGNRSENYGINMRTSSSSTGGAISRINFGDTATSSGNIGPRYLSFSVGRNLNELMYLTDNNNGRVGIGTTSPSTKLDVQGSQSLNAAITGSDTKNAIDINIAQNGYGYGNRVDNYGINMRSSSSGWGGPVSRINFGDVSTGTATGPRYLSFSVGRNLNELMWLTDDLGGRVGIGTLAPTSTLSVNGSADKPGGGSWGTFSDKRVKKDIEDFNDGLNVIKQLRTVTYKYNEKSGYKDLDKKYVGFIAQEVEKAAPYMVNTIDDSAKSGLKDKKELDESALTKILVNAVKEQQKEIEDLKLQVQQLVNKK